MSQENEKSGRIVFGEYLHRVDDKGRVIIPADFREELGYKFMVTKDLIERCLKLYSMDDWKRLVEKYEKLPSSNKAVQMQRRLLFQSAALCEIDKQGRITIPYKLREDTGIGKEVAIAGDGNKAEIWDKDTREAYFANTDMSLEKAAEIVAELEKAL
ncbi:MAG: division/cell wall cluster transcriptional repressor MraZ [Clostridia bacterium]|nr:division/cell wall cluster transcriptional repressor MraZ [Clostridia bacterium]